jgi:hypothetical protein
VVALDPVLDPDLPVRGDVVGRFASVAVVPEVDPPLLTQPFELGKRVAQRGCVGIGIHEEELVPRVDRDWNERQLVAFERRLALTSRRAQQRPV